MNNSPTYLNRDKFRLELERCAGLIPIAIDVENRKMEWLDLETWHCYEGFFRISVERFIALKGALNNESPVKRFVTDLDLISDESFIKAPIYPSGFIFHAGRCGSTLLARVLARDEHHHVVSEAEIHNQIWQLLTNDDTEFPAINESNKQLYRNLLLATGRKRLARHDSYFIKFTSFNIRFFDFIRSVFPDVPAIFLYRDPDRILESFVRNPPPWLDPVDPGLAWVRRVAGIDSVDDKEKGIDLEQSAANALKGFFEAGLGAANLGATLLNYEMLAAENLAVILDVFGVKSSARQLSTMRSQFELNSKTDNRAERFARRDTAESSGKETADKLIYDRLKLLYSELCKSRSNLELNSESSQHTDQT